MRAAKRLRLDGPASHLLHTIVENHLLMAGVSQRRDLDDPAVIRQFARQIQTPETLDLLTLLTFADSQGTSDKLWNGFKDLLLWQLHDRAMALLTGGTEFVRASRKQRESLLQEVRELAPKSISNEEVNAHFVTLPQRYFEIHTAKDIGDDLELTHLFMRRLILEDDRVLSPATAWQDEPDRGYNLVKVAPGTAPGCSAKLPARSAPSAEHSQRANFYAQRWRRARQIFRQRRPNRQPRAARAPGQIHRVARKGFE